MAAPFISICETRALAIDVAGMTLPLYAAHPSLPRYDLVLMRPLPWGTDVHVVCGMPSVSPVTPAVPERFTCDSPGWTVLARIMIRPGQVTVHDDDIESLL